MKKILATILIASLSISLTGCACGKPKSSASDTTPTARPTKKVVINTPVVTPTTAVKPTESAAPTEAVHEHNYIVKESESIAPTCQTEGKTVYECSCGDTYEEVIPASPFAHVPAEPIVIPATVNYTGMFLIKCSICGRHLSEETLPQLTPTPTPSAD